MHELTVQLHQKDILLHFLQTHELSEDTTQQLQNTHKGQIFLLLLKIMTWQARNCTKLLHRAVFFNAFRCKYPKSRYIYLRYKMTRIKKKICNGVKKINKLTTLEDIFLVLSINSSFWGIDLIFNLHYTYHDLRMLGYFVQFRRISLSAEQTHEWLSSFILTLVN